MMMKMTKMIMAAAAFTALVGCSGGGSSITASSSAEEVYGQVCASCHDGGLKGWLTSAPETGDKEAWKPLIAKGVDAMTAFSMKGVNKMPAKGACDNCSEEQVRATIEYMVEQSK